jgi:hypothetical protein
MIFQAAVIITIAIFFSRATFADLKDTSAFRMGGVICVSTLLLALYYLLFSGAPHFYGRYLAPLMLVSIPLAGIALAYVNRFGHLLRFLVLSSLALIAALSILGYHFQIGVSKSPFYNDQLQLIEASVPRSEVVSAGQSGTIGYFRDRVVNLDGKVNPEALHYRHAMWEYLKARNIAWYCDWASGFLGPDPAANGWTVVGRRGSFLLYHYTSTR